MRKSKRNNARNVQTIRKRIYGELKSIGIRSIDSKPLSGCKNRDLFKVYKENFSIDEDSLKALSKTLSIKNKLESSPVVYFIGNKDYGFVKIGHSNNVSRRLTQIRVGCPFPLDILLTIETEEPINLEKSLHKSFRKTRCQGEWFKIDNKIENYLLNELQ